MDTQRFHPPPTPVEDPIVVFVSPLAENKGIDRVLDAFAIVRRRVPDARLRVVGRGPLEPLVRAAANRAGSGVELVGWRAPDALAEELRGAAVFTTAPRPTPVWSEQFGLAYVEAMATGLPVVTTRCGSNHEAVRAPNLRVDDDAEALADGLLVFLNDADRRRRTGELNRQEVVERYERGQQLRRLRAAFDTAAR
jgi:glycosyltransferase involved in cell wall biosynthesis